MMFQKNYPKKDKFLNFPRKYGLFGGKSFEFGVAFRQVTIEFG